MNIRRHKHTLTFIILLACALPFLHGCNDQSEQTKKYDYEKKFPRGPLSVRVQLDNQNPDIADLVELTLTIESEEQFVPTLPILSKKLTDETGLSVYQTDPESTTLLDNNHTLTTKTYQLEPLQTGTCTIPALSISFAEKIPVTDDKPKDQPTAKSYEITTDEIAINVTDTITDENATLADIKDVTIPPTKINYLLYGISGAALLLIAIIIILLARRKPKQKQIIRVYKTAHELALEKLAQLNSEDLIAQGQLKQYYERISNILRWYIEHRFNLNAPEQTTEEFLIAAGRSNELTDDHKNSLKQFLNHCDMVKFAKYTPSHDEVSQTSTLTEQFIQTTKSDEKKVDVTNDSQSNQKGGAS